MPVSRRSLMSVPLPEPWSISLYWRPLNSTDMCLREHRDIGEYDIVAECATDAHGQAGHRVLVAVVVARDDDQLAEHDRGQGGFAHARLHATAHVVPAVDSRLVQGFPVVAS